MTPPPPVELVTTLALRPGMRVYDGQDPRATEHVVAAVEHPGAGCWDIAWADCPQHSVVGARHPWRVAS